MSETERFCSNRDIIDLREKLARVEERLLAADNSAKITAHAFDAYKTAANEWRQALNDQRNLFVTRSEVIAIVSLMLVVVGIIVSVVVRLGVQK